MSFTNLRCIEVDAREMSLPVVGRVVNEIDAPAVAGVRGDPDRDVTLVVRIFAGEPAALAQIAARLNDACSLYVLVAGDQVSSHREALALAWACEISGDLDAGARRVLAEAHDRSNGLMVRVDGDDPGLGFESTCLELPDALARVGADGIWRDGDGAEIDLAEAVDRTPPLLTQLVRIVPLPTKDRIRFLAHAGSAMGFGHWQLQASGYAALGFDDHDPALTSWIAGLAPNTSPQATRFESFPSQVWEPRAWPERAPTTREQRELVIAAAWMLEGAEDVLLEAFDLLPSPGGLLRPVPHLPRLAEFILQAMRVAVLSRGTRAARERVCRAIVHIGHPGVRRTLGRLAAEAPELSSVVPNSSSGAARRRQDRWSDGRGQRDQLIFALTKACGQEPTVTR